MVLEQGRMTDEGIAELRTRIGSRFSGDYLFTHNKVMTRQAIAHWSDGIGDYNNRLYRDEEYARKTRFGSIIAPPCSLSSASKVNAAKSNGLPRWWRSSRRVTWPTSERQRLGCDGRHPRPYVAARFPTSW